MTAETRIIIIKKTDDGVGINSRQENNRLQMLQRVNREKNVIFVLEGRKESNVEREIAKINKYQKVLEKFMQNYISLCLSKITHSLKNTCTPF